MFSLIVCSRDKEELEALRTNVSKTIGAPFELIALDNGGNTYSIYTAYNKGAAQAQGRYLVFLHEDVRFLTANWGGLLHEHLEQAKDTGVIGIGGSRYMPSVPSGWFLGYGTAAHVRLNILQGANSLETYERRRLNPEGVKRQEVTVLDGVLMAVRREVWEQHPFDSRGFNGFHFYDLDFCLQVNQQYRNYVVFDIDLVHRSEGQNRRDWIEEALKFTAKWRHQLPRSVAPVPAHEKRRIEWAQFYYFAKRVREHYNYPATAVLCLREAPWRFFYPKGYLKLLYYLVGVFPFRKTLLN
jgi:hypothetical protein